MSEEEKSRQEAKAEEEEGGAFKMAEDWGPLGVIV